MNDTRLKVWDRAQKKFYYLFSLNFTDAPTIIAWVKTEDGFDRALVIGETADLLQSIGRQSKNRKEIYEGDIVQMREVSGWDEKKERQTFKKTLWRVSWEKDRWHLFDAKDIRWDNGMTYEDYDDTVTWEELKAIGNTYENPELLNG